MSDLIDEKIKYESIVQSLNKKIKRGKLKPYDEGYNKGIECALQKIDGMKQSDYETIKSALKKELNRFPFNRGDGFNNAILSAISKIREVYKVN